MKLATKLSLVISILALVIVLSEGLISYYNGRRIIEEETINHLTSVNLLKKSAVELWIEGAGKDLELFAQRPALRDLTAAFLASGEADTAAYYSLHDDHLDIAARERSDYLEFFILNLEDGEIIISSDRDQEGKLRENEPYFRAGRNDTFTQEIYFTHNEELPVMTVSTPLVDRQGRTIAVLAGHLNLANLAGIIEQRGDSVETKDAYLVNRSNYFASEPRMGGGYVLKEKAFSEGVEAALSGINGVSYYDNYQGVPVIGAYSWLPASNMALITEIDQEEAYSSIAALGRQTVVMGIGLVLLAGIVGWFVSLTISKPVKLLVLGTEEISRGNLDCRVQTSGRDEIAALGKAFNQMTAELQNTLISRDLLIKSEQQLKQALSDLERSNKELEQFAYVASHDLQEPLRMISSYTQLLADKYKDVLDETAQKYINYAVDGALRLQRQIVDLLRYSRVGTRGAPSEPVDSHALLGESIHNLAAIIEESQAIVTNDDLPYVKADPAQLVQVFQNLIENAIKYRGAYLPYVHIRVEDNDHEWVFSVRDNGIGIDQQYKDKIFVIFQRLHTQQEYSGTGIGLALCKRIINRHGGKIWFESEPGKGSTFYFTLPK